MNEESMMKSMANFMRQSLGGSRGDLDLRKLTFLDCLRKLFEESRANHI